MKHLTLLSLALMFAISAVAADMLGETDAVLRGGCKITACDSQRGDLRVMDEVAPAPKASGSVERK